MPNYNSFGSNFVRLLCITDKIKESLFFHICEELDEEIIFGVPNPLETDIIFTDLIFLMSYSKDIKIVLYVDKIEKSNAVLRRQFQLRPEVEVFCSPEIAKTLQNNYGIKPIVLWEIEEMNNPKKKVSNLEALAEKVKRDSARRALKKTPAIEQKIPVYRKITKTPPPLPEITYSREPYTTPTSQIVTALPWFSHNKQVDVSIIVPMFRSAEVISQQIASWHFEENQEIIYVNDRCPNNSTAFVIKSWEKRNNPHPIGKLIELSNNSGFSSACNEGAKHANGKYLIFLNADTRVTENWVSPIISLLEDEKIGIVGNMQLKDDGSIDSAGSEWMWDSKSFEHIGRNVYNGKRLGKMMNVSDLPPDLLVPAERDMVTGCCLGIRKELFDEIGGFNTNYRIGYWEDSDINMEVKSRGYKVYFQPHSKIYHKTGHSRSSLHPFIMDNTRFFYDKWVNTFKIDPLVKSKRK